MSAGGESESDLTLARARDSGLENELGVLSYRDSRAARARRPQLQCTAANLNGGPAKVGYDNCQLSLSATRTPDSPYSPMIVQLERFTPGRSAT
jgi:hypothetical protein